VRDGFVHRRHCIDGVCVLGRGRLLSTGDAGCHPAGRDPQVKTSQIGLAAGRARVPEHFSQETSRERLRAILGLAPAAPGIAPTVAVAAE
jgi:hypothetical protein